MSGIRSLLEGWATDEGPPAGDCRCSVSIDDGSVRLDGEGCPGGGDLAAESGCRATAIEALAGADGDTVRTRHMGVECTYLGEAGRLLGAAAEFVATARPFDDAVAAMACADPIEAADAAASRADAVRSFAADAGLDRYAGECGDYDRLLAPARAPAFAHSLVHPRPPEAASMRWERSLDVGTVRCYEGDPRPTYHLTPAALELAPAVRDRLDAAHDALVETGGTGPAAVSRALAEVAGPGDPVERMRRILERHRDGLGLVGCPLADPAVSDLYVSAPVHRAPVSVVCDGEAMATNLQLSATATGALASHLRRESGRPLSRASPTVDAAITAGPAERPVRAAAVAPPVSDGLAFAFRAGGSAGFTLPRLVANGTVPPRAAALCSLAVERGLAVLVAGPRGAGKTTTLGALCWELPAGTRMVVLEDTPELPIEALQRAGRDVQGLTVDSGVGAAVDAGAGDEGVAETDGPAIAPATALRTALRLGEGALVVGEVRGPEAPVLFEAMRVGAGASAVLGTVHGHGAEDVRDRLVEDLGVPPPSVAATDLVVTLSAVETEDDTARRVVAVEEIEAGESGACATALFEQSEAGLASTGRLRSGASRVVETLAPAGQSYADVLTALDDRAAALNELADRGLVGPEQVSRAYAQDRSAGTNGGSEG